MRFLKLLTAILLVAGTAFADVPSSAFTYTFDRLSGVPAARKYKLGTEITEAHTRATCVYDLSYGVGTGNVALRNTDGLTPCTLPAKALILNVAVNVTTAVTSSGSATVGVQTVGGSTDLLTATAKASLGAAVKLLGTPVFATASTWVKVGASDVGVQAAIGTAALLTGHFRVFIDYARGE